MSSGCHSAIAESPSSPFTKSSRNRKAKLRSKQRKATIKSIVKVQGQIHEKVCTRLKQKAQKQFEKSKTEFIVTHKLLMQGKHTESEKVYTDCKNRIENGLQKLDSCQTITKTRTLYKSKFNSKLNVTKPKLSNNIVKAEAVEASKRLFYLNKYKVSD